MANQTINLNFTPANFQPCLYFSQGDVGRVFQINLLGIEIPSGATVTMQGTKPSGLGFTVEADSVADNIATFTTVATMTNEHGRFPAEIHISSGSVEVGTANFLMVGEKNPHPNTTVDGDAEQVIPQLTLLVERVETAASSVLDMEVEAQTLPAGSAATYSYNEEENKVTFGIPEGQAGSGAVGTVASAYSATKTYAVGDYAIQNGNLYRCTTAITTAEAWTSGHWAQVALAPEVSDLKSAFNGFKNDGLPYGYKRIDYIEANNAQDFKLGITPSANDVVNAVFSVSDNDTWRYLVGTRETGDSSTSTDQSYIILTPSYGSPADNVLFKNGTNSESLVDGFELNKIYSISATIPADYAGTTREYSMFGMNYQGDTLWGSRFKGRLYSFSIDGKTNLVPCKRLGDSKLGMYDTVRDLFFVPAENRVFAGGDIGMLNILDLGAKNDGSADVGTIINNYTGLGGIYLPAGEYLVSTPITLKNPLVGEGRVRQGKAGDAITLGTTNLISGITSGNLISVSDSRVNANVKSLNIFLKGDENGIVFTSSASRCLVEDVSIFNISNAKGIQINPSTFDSRAIFIDNCTLFAKPNSESIGIYGAVNGSDARITNTEMMYVQCGIHLVGGIWYLSNIHIWTGSNSSITESWYKDTKGLSIAGGEVFGNNIYLDSALAFIYFDGQPKCWINNLILWDDGTGDQFGLSQSVAKRQNANQGQLYVNGGVLHTNKPIDINVPIYYNSNLNKYRNFRNDGMISAITASNYKRATLYPYSTDENQYFITRATTQDGSFIEVADVILENEDVKNGHAWFRISDANDHTSEIKVNVSNNTISVGGSGTLDGLFYKNFDNKFIRVYASAPSKDVYRYEYTIEGISANRCSLANLESVSAYDSVYKGEILTSNSGLTEIAIS